MKDPRQFGSPAMFRGFRVLLIVAGVALAILAVLFFVFATRPTSGPFADTPGQPEVSKEFPETAPDMNVLEAIKMAGINIDVAAEARNAQLQGLGFRTNGGHKVTVTFQSQKNQTQTN